MKRQKRKAKRNQGPKVSAPTSPAPEKPRKKPSRRAFFKQVSSSAVLVAAVGGGGWYLVREVMAGIRESDLTQIGQGIPTVVQIHDPECPRCRALQKEARKAMAEFSDEELRYLVANIRTSEGRSLATEHGVGHVTLLLFDANGQRRDVLVGPSTSEILESAFRRHIARGASS